MRKNPAIHRVALALTPGAPIFELAVPCEVFGIARPEIADPWYRFDVCATQPGAVVSAGFAAVGARNLDTLVEADTVVVPACTDVQESPPAELVEAVAAAHRRGARIASICSGAFVLAAAGILDGRKATTHWMHAELLARRYPRVRVDPNVIYTQDDRVFTSAGTAAGIDLCLELVRQDHGTAAANALARRLVTPPHRNADQAQFILSPVAEGTDSPLADTLQWARDHLDQPIRVRDLARIAHLSERQLSRKFLDLLGCNPGEWLHRERLRRAQELLELTDHTIDRVAFLSGFGTAAGLRAAFVQHLHVSPSQYRKTWAA